MPHQLGSSSPDVGGQSHENQILAEFEGILNNISADRIDNDRNVALAESRWVRRLVPIALLAGVGAVALALVPMGLKSDLMTGRSVAHAPQDR